MLVFFWEIRPITKPLSNLRTTKEKPMKVINEAKGKNWHIYHADCVDVASQLPDNCIDLSVYSPPFANLYIYGDSVADMGNCAGDKEFFDQYKFLAKEMLRITTAGRLTVIHCKDLPAYFGSDGYAGLKDFPGEIIRVHEKAGWNFHSRVTIWKCPVTERERTNNNGLLHKTVLRDQSQLRQGMADYLIIMRKPPTDGMLSDKPISTNGFQGYIGDPTLDPREDGQYHPSPYSRNATASVDSINVWRRYAEPVWWDINQQDVLNSKLARDDKDSKHICPLQLGLIRRVIQLWSIAGDKVFSPFMGVGSEGVCAIEMGRKFIGTELKDTYFENARQFISQAESSSYELF
jgi:DNA modification methylase